MSGKKIDELDAYKIYVAMKSHFQGEYDYKKFNHGQAISIGMITEAKISNYLGLLSTKELEKIIL